MKRIIVTILSILILDAAIGQVEQMVYLVNGEYVWAEYIKQDKSKLTMIPLPVKKNDTIIFDKHDVLKTQTLGIRFLDDEYNNFLAQGTRRLEFQKLCHTENWGVHISGREINDSLIILLKLKQGNESMRDFHQVICDGDNIKLLLESGDTILMTFHNTYLLQGVVLYNFGIIAPSKRNIESLINSPIQKVYLGGDRCVVNDSYCLMRSLLALLEEN